MGYRLRNFLFTTRIEFCQKYTLHNPTTHSRIRSDHTATGSLEYPVLFMIDPLQEYNQLTRVLTSRYFHITPSSYNLRIYTVRQAPTLSSHDHRGQDRAQRVRGVLQNFFRIIGRFFFSFGSFFSNIKRGFPPSGFSKQQI